MHAPATTPLIPADAILAEAWARLRHAADDPTHPLRLLALASVGLDQRPAVRLMILRGADQHSSRVWFHTDRRSPKAADIRANPAVSLVAYDPRDGIQLRLAGLATLKESEPQTRHHWSQASSAARYLYAALDAPGSIPREPDLFLPPDAEALSHSLTLRARANFAVIEVAIDSIDWLQIRADRQRRAILHATTNWRPTPSSP